VLGWTHPSLLSLGLRPVARLQPTPHTRLHRFGIRPPFTPLPPRTHGLPRPHPPHVLPSALRSGLYGPSTITLEYGCVRRCLQLGIVKGLRGGWAFSGASSTDWGFFGFSHFWVLSWVFSRCFLLVASFLHIFVVIFNAPALGAGFRPWVFSPTASTASTMGWTG